MADMEKVRQANELRRTSLHRLPEISVFCFREFVSAPNDFSRQRGVPLGNLAAELIHRGGRILSGSVDMGFDGGFHSPASGTNQ